MAKRKKSIFEKITGIKRVDDDEMYYPGSRPPRRNSYFSEFETDEDDLYEFPENDQFAALDQSDDDYEEDYPIEPTPAPAPAEPVAPEEPQFVAPQPAPVQSPSDDAAAEGQLTIDVYQTEEHIVIKSTIAGVKPEDLDVNINNDMVTIRGERKQDEEIDAENYYYQECYWGPFSRSVILPVEILPEKAEAAMKNGILTIRLPKAETGKTRKLQVKGF